MSLSLFRFPSLSARLWVFGQMGAARLSFRRMPEVGFYKLCGSGSGEGFTPRPNLEVWSILATWPDAETARARITSAAVFGRWRAHAAESWTIVLEPVSARGRWSGVQPFIPAESDAAALDTAVSALGVADAADQATVHAGADLSPHQGPIVALTRATLRATTFLRFWQRVPDISATIGQDPNVIFKIGLGEVPLMHQITFSIWPDAAAMANFARGNGPHGRAIAAVRAQHWFTEELYARFRILDAWGTWGGRDPLTAKDAA